MSFLAYAALWVFVFSVPWEGVFQIIPGIAVVTRATGALAAALVLLTIVLAGRWRRWHLFHVAVLLFVLWAGCGLLIVHVSEIPAKYWTYVQLFLVLCIMWECARSRTRQLGLLMAYVLGAYVSAIGTVMVYRSHAGALRRYSAGGVDANGLANVLALALPMAWYLGMTYRRPILRALCRAYVPLGLLAIGLTGSRGGMLSTVVALLVVPLTMTNLTPARLAAIVVMLGLGGALAIAYVPDTIFQRLATTTSEVEEGNLHGRVEIWKAGLSAFTQRPLTGYGTAGYKSAAGQWGFRRVAHNSFLAVLVEQGILGFALYAAMFITVFRAVLTLPRVERRLALVLLATLCIAMLPLSWEDSKSAWLILGALLGLAHSRAILTGGSAALAGPLPRPGKLRRPSVAPPIRASGGPGNAVHRDLTG